MRLKISVCAFAFLVTVSGVAQAQETVLLCRSRSEIENSKEWLAESVRISASKKSVYTSVLKANLPLEIRDGSYSWSFPLRNAEFNAKYVSVVDRFSGEYTIILRSDKSDRDMPWRTGVCQRAEKAL